MCRIVKPRKNKSRSAVINSSKIEENNTTRLNSRANTSSEIKRMTKFPSQKEEKNSEKYREKVPELPQGTILKHIHFSKTL